MNDCLFIRRAIATAAQELANRTADGVSDSASFDAQCAWLCAHLADLVDAAYPPAAEDCGDCGACTDCLE